MNSINYIENKSLVYGWSSRKAFRRELLCVVSPKYGAFPYNSDMITLRENQAEPIEKAIRFFQEAKPKPSLIVLPTAWGKSILTAYVAKNSNDKLIVLQPSKELLEQNYLKYCTLCGDFGSNAGIYSASFGRVEDIRFEHGKMWRMFGTGGRLLSGIPIHDIGKYTREDTQAIDARANAPIEIMPFGKYKGNRIADIPLQYRQWMIRAFEWNARNEKLRKSILTTL